jgi:hypothetical protein
MSDLRLAASQPFARNLFSRLSPVGRSSLLAVPFSLAAGAKEFGDDDDLETNIKQGLARSTADLGSNVALATLGAALFGVPTGGAGAPIGAIALPAIASLFGLQDEAGKAAASIFNKSKAEKLREKLDLKRIEREFDFETAQMNEDRMRRLLAQQIQAQQNANLQAEGAANLNNLLNIGY